MNFGRMPVFLVGVALWAPYCSLGHSYRWTSTSANRATPTVTAEAGDQGGRFFGQVPDATQTRHYYIAAEWQLWDYAPVNKDPICGAVPTTPQREVSTRARKLRYVQYTDDTFTTRVSKDLRLGIVGPVLRGVVGEYLAVTFLNRSERPLSMHPHGVRYDKDSEGAYYKPRPGLGGAVGPKARFTYVWKLESRSGPQPNEPSSKAWLYHSHVHDDEEINLGLVGMLIVTDPERARPDGTPNDIDREIPALFMIFDETGSLLDPFAAKSGAVPLPPNGVSILTPRTFSDYLELRAQGARHAINGFTFGNLQGLDINEGDRVRWYTMGLGGQEDFHSVHWHGHPVLEEGRRETDTVELLPGSMKVADMVADNPGTWLMQCHVADHMMEGMFAFYTVHSKVSPGVDRSAASAFLGLTKSSDALRVSAGQVERVAGARDARFRKLRFTGSLLIPKGLSVVGKKLRLQWADRSVAITLDPRGRGEVDEVQFVTLNAGTNGVILGEFLEFDIAVIGASWQAVIPEPLPASEAPGQMAKAVTLPFLLALDGATHSTLLRLTYTNTQRP